MSSPTEIVSRLLANTSNPTIVAELVAPDATYISLCYSNPALKKLMPYSGVHDREGPSAVTYTFSTVAKIWNIEDFQIEALFGHEADVAVFGRFTYRSATLGKVYTSPFSIHCKVNEGRIGYMLFMEDTVSRRFPAKLSQMHALGRHELFADFDPRSSGLARRLRRRERRLTKSSRGRSLS
jgi:uncharacterized protein